MVHGGNVQADTLVYRDEKEPQHLNGFQEIYGLHLDSIFQLSELSAPVAILSKCHTDGFHLTTL